MRAGPLLTTSEWLYGGTEGGGREEREGGWEGGRVGGREGREGRDGGRERGREGGREGE